VKDEASEGQLVQKQDVGGGGGVMAPQCGIPSGCPADFCTPYPSKMLASWARDHMAPVLLAGIAAKVNPRVVPLWYKYLYGGSGVQDLSTDFGGDFTSSVITGKTTDILGKALTDSIEKSPPVFPPGEDEVTVDAASRISSELGMVGRPDMGPPEMNFWKFDEIPGNIAGGIGKTQTTCPAGAQPGPFDDERTAEGTARVIRNPDGTLTVKPQFRYVVKDTIDLCPGNCGAKIEQVATVPLSRFEATGISGDIPFIVRFPSPPRSFVARPSAPPPTPPSEAFPGTITASSLRIRREPSTSAPVLGSYPRGTRIEVLCQTGGEAVDGNPMWNKTDRGYVADRYVSRDDTLPPKC
jgi:SH3 domain-containing protein